MAKFYCGGGLSRFFRRRRILGRAVEPVLSRFRAESLERRVLLSTAPPYVVSTALGETTVGDKLVFQFSSDVSGSLNAGDLLVRDQATGAVLSSSALALSYDVKQNQATFTFPGLAGGTLSDDRYEAVLLSSGITDSSGAHLDGNHDGTGGDNFFYHFSRLTGDVDQDGAVDFPDLVILARHFGSTSFPQADLNGDGTVDFPDLVILARHFGRTLAGAPLIAAGLAHDTGRSSTDNITNDATIAGTVANVSAAADVRAGFDAAPVSTFPSILSDLHPDGSFTLTPAMLQQINGGTALPDGLHTLHLLALNGSGQVIDAFDAPFTLKTTPPAPPTFGLDPGVANPALGQNTTTFRSVTLIGHADPGAQLSLGNVSVLAGADGSFSFPDVALNMGGNGLTITETDIAGNTSSATQTFTRVVPPSSGQVALDWDQTVLNAIQLDDSDPLYASRAMAMMSAAVYDAVNSVDGATSFLYVHAPASAGASDIAAAAQAAHDVLVYVYPAQQATFNAQLAGELSAITDGTSKSQGISVGQYVAGAIIGMRKNDGATSFTDYTPGTAPGQWQPTFPSYMPALRPNWATLEPFLMTSDSQFRPSGPPALNSAQYATDVNQVQSLGAVNSTTRTADETQAAKFWNDAGGSYTPPGHWDQIASLIASQQNLGLASSARLFAELNVAMADAGIAVWDAKFTYNFWRPIQAIQQANSAGNSAVTQDSNWLPLITTPAFPEYVSGHSTFSATAATVLDAFFGSNVSFSIGSVGVPGVTRSFAGFDAAAQEAAMSRIWGGIHFNTAVQDGVTIGKALGQYELQKFNDTTDTAPPVVTITAPQPSTAANTDPTITGQVTDNLSGVASLQYAVDSGSFAPLSFDASGHFAITPELPLDGSADGPHVLHLEATDYAGNTTADIRFPFTLDTKVPTIALTAPMDNGTLATGASLAGAASGTGSALVSLSYAFDGGSSMPILFSSSDGSFSQPLDLSHLSAGPHTLVVTAQDAAGNSASTTLHLSLPSMIPLTVASFAPASGATDVGSTFRAKVTFSRAIDPTTLNSNDFYAIDTTGTKLPATIVPSDDGTYAWLFFTSPMPGGSMITITVDGSQIKAPDGAKLDAADNGTAGSKLTDSFTTVSLAALPNTSLSGIVADPGPDLQPGTIDDVSPGPDGVLGTADDVYKLPIAGVTVSIAGTNLSAVTGADGKFSFPSVPAGDVKLMVEGPTATNAPAGYYFPEMVMDLNLLPGQANTVMAAMQGTGTGNSQPGAKLPTALGVYLPRVHTSILQTVNPTGMTHIGVDATSAPGLTPQQQQMLSIDVPGGVAVGMNGQKMSNVQMGISTVPPSLVMDMLPSGLMQHTFDITIQAPGVATFSQPVAMTFPNVFNAAPGTQLNFLSFDHTTGRLVIEGTATVSADGLSVHTDPGTGITHPGWHGMTQPGSPSDPPCDPETVHDVDVPPVLRTLGVQDYFYYRDQGTLNLSFGNFANKLDPNGDPCSDENDRATPLLVDVTLDDGSANQFLMGVNSQSFILEPGQVGNINGSVKQLLGQIATYDTNRLYGVKVHIHSHWVDSEGVDHDLGAQDVYVYRFLDIADNKHQDDRIDFVKTLATATRNIIQKDALKYFGDPAAQEALAVANGSQFAVAGDQVEFNPSATGQQSDTLNLTAPDSMVFTIALGGLGLNPQLVLFSTATFASKIKALINASPAIAQTDRLTTLFPNPTTDPTGFQNMVNSIASEIRIRFYQIFARVDPLTLSGITIMDSATGTGDLVDMHNAAIEGNNAASPGAASAYWADFGRNFFNNTIVANEANESKPQRQFLFGSITNQSASDNTGMTLNIDVKAMQVGYTFNPAAAGNAAFTDAFENRMANSLAHEIGHLIGAIHERTDAEPYAPGSVMGDDGQMNPLASYGAHFAAIVKYALGIPVTTGEFDAAYGYYKDQIHNETYRFNNGATAAVVAAQSETEAVADPHDDTTDLAVNQPQLSVLDGPADNGSTPNPVSSVDFGTVTADGPGGALVTKTLYLFNTGDQPLAISNVHLVGGNTGFSMAGFSGPVVLPALDLNNIAPSRLAITVTFDPTLFGSAADVLQIASNSGFGSPYSIPLTGSGISPNAVDTVVVADNNFGGVTMGAGPHLVTHFATIDNTGSQSLTISGISVVAGTNEFAVSGLPGTFPGQPIVVAPGASLSFDASFTPGATGLQRGEIDILSNDPQTPTYRLHVVGTGLPATGSDVHYGHDFVVVEDLDTNTVISRQISDAAGNWKVFLPPQTHIHFAIFDPISGLIADGYTLTAASGQTTKLPTTPFHASTAIDPDGDGLPKDIDNVIGTSLTKPDTNGDGIDDFTSIQEGINPLGPAGVATGIIANLTLAGQANDVVVEGSPLNQQKETAYVATSTGLAIADVSSLTKPLLLSQLTLSGNSTDVAVDPNLNIAAVASNSGGLVRIDVSDPTNPRVLQTLNVNANHVRIANGLAYAAVNGSIQSFDLTTGELIQTLPLSTSTITGMALEGSMLYTIDSSKVLRAIDITSLQMVARGSLTMPGGGQKLFVGNGVAYVGAGGPFLGGFATADVSNPDNIRLLGGVNGTNIAGTEVLANGSGAGLAIGSPGGVFGAHAADVVTLSDPTNTNAFVTRFVLPADPQGAAIAGGIAFIADGSSGLQVLNYLPFDNKGVPPVVSIDTSKLDVDPNTPGIQVVEGSTIQLKATISDDVQVRNVEVLLNGQVIRNDVSFPYDLTVTMPALSAGSSTATVQLQATDTGGNTTITPPITLNLVKDTTPPVLLSITPSSGAVTAAATLRSVQIGFSKPLAPSTVTVQNFFLKDPNGAIITPASIELRGSGTGVELVLPPPPQGGYAIGTYQIVIHAAAVTDRAGNAMGTADFVSTFKVAQFTAIWSSAGDGFWDDPTNWQGGVVPASTDSVFVPAGVTVTYRTNATSVASLVCGGTLNLTGGTLSLGAASSVATLNLSGGTLAGAGDVTVTGTLNWTAGTMSGAGKTLIAAGATLNLSNNSTYGLNRELDNNGTATWTSGILYMTGGTFVNQAGGTFTVNSTSLLESFSGGGTNAFNNAGSFTQQGTGQTQFISGVPFNNTGTVNVQAGQLRLSGGGANSATMTVAAAATLTFSGDYTHAMGATLSGAGTLSVTNGTQTLAIPVAVTIVSISGGTLSVGSASSVATLNLSGGTLAGAGDVTVTGTLNWTVGTMSGAGKTLVAAGATLNLSNSLHALNRELDNSGTATWTSGALYMTGGTFVNQAGGAFTVNSTSLLQSFSGGGTNAFNNAGSFTQQGTGQTQFISGVAFNNTGTVNVQAGQLLLFGGGSNSATMTVAAAATLQFGGDYTHAMGATLSGAGTLSVTGGTQTLAIPVAVTIVNLSNGTLSVGSASSVATLNLSGGTLAGAGDLTVTGTLNWTAGTMSGAGRTLIAAGATLNLSNSTHSLNRELDNNGTATWTGGIIYMTGGTFVNQAAGTFTVNSSSTLQSYSGGGTNAFNNAGSFTQQGTGQTQFTSGVAFNNTGTVSIQAGQLLLSAGGTNSATMTVAAAATLAFGGDYTHATGSTLSGAGTLSITNGTQTFAGTTTISITTVNLSGGTLAGSADLTVTGTLTWTGGTMSGAGKTVIAAAGTLNLSNSTHTLSRELDNKGTTNWTAGLLYMIGGTFINQAGATFTANSSSTLQSYGGGGTNDFTNAGSFTQQGTGQTQFASSAAAVPFNNTGTVNVTGGQLTLSAGGSNSAAMNVSAGATLSFGGDYTHAAGGTLSGAGTLSITNGTQTFAAATSISVSTVNLSGGTIAGSSDLTLTGALTWTGGAMSGAGKTVIAATGALNLSNSTHTLSRELDNNGTATWTAGLLYMIGGTFTNQAGGTFTANSNSSLQSYGGGGVNAFNNAGTFIEQGTGQTQFASSAAAVPFNNTGMVNVTGGQLMLSAGGSNSAAMNVSAGATLSFGGDYTDAAGATFAGAGTLSITNGTQTFVAATTLGTATVSLSGGTLAGSANITVTGTLNWTGGTMSGAGKTVIAAAGTLYLSNSTHTLSRELDNNGTATWTAGLLYMIGGTFVNQAGATFTANSNSSLQSYGGGGVNAFNNAGTFIQQGTGQTQFASSATNVVFNNTGSTTIQSGSLLLTSPSANAGTFTIDAGAVLNVSGSFTNSAGGTLTIQLGGTAASQIGKVAVTGSAALAGTLNVNLVNGFTPASGNTFQILTCSALSGTFTTVNKPGGINVTYNSNNVTLSA